MELRTVSLADQVFERLESEILSGQYARGEILTEMKLCADLGVSRTPVREAIRRLEQEHLIEYSPKGVVVIGVGEQDLEDIYDIRLALEGLAAAKAAECITEERLAELKEVLELQEFYVSKKDAEHIRTTDSRFHSLIYRATGSSAYDDTLALLHRKTQKFRKASVENSSRAEASVQEHRAVYEAIAAHAPAAANAAMQTHVANARKHIMKG
ncbi:MAG: GntR family transcriptional regulator [Clostridia bacterium]|nr:GntR family transcriptional regulator [Clostridia bacterium]